MSPPIEPLPVQDLDVLLRETLGKNLQITHVDWKPLTDPGENFGSVILAIDVTIACDNKTEKLNLVAKLPPNSEYLLDLFHSSLTFKKELYFYRHTLKGYRAIQLEHGIKEDELCILAPKYFGGRLGVENDEVFDKQAAIVLENLKMKGYDTKDRINGMDKVHTEYAIRQLAKLHAFTIALKIKKPEYFGEYIQKILTQGVNKTAENCVIGMIRKGLQDLSNLPDSKPHIERINRTIEYGIKNFHGTEIEEPWGTMIHNDFWVNNMMFRHKEDGSIMDMKIVDFQLCTYQYGMCDLIFFLLSSAQKDVLDDHLDYMLEVYYDAFVQCLKSLDVNTAKLTKQKYYELLKACAPSKFNQCIMMVQVIQASRKSNDQTKNLKGDDIFLSRVVDDISSKKLAHILQIFVKKDWLLK